MKIGILGTPVSSGNRGVLALGGSLLNLSAEASGGGDVVLLVANRSNTPVTFRIGAKPQIVPVVNARMSPRSKPSEHFAWIVCMALLYRAVPFRVVRSAIARSVPWIGVLSESTVVGDIRGGDSFSDIYGMQRFVYGFLMAATVLLVTGRLVQFPQTYGPYKSALARRMARFLLRRSSIIIARDLKSQRVAQELVGDEKQVRLSPDVAFSLEVVRPAEIELTPPLSGSMPPGVIGLNVNGLMYNGGYSRKNMFGLKLDYTEFLTELATSLLAEHPGELWLVPHTFSAPGDVESDQDASVRLRESLPAALQERVRIVIKEYDAHELKGIIGQCDFFIGSRMHSCIAALSQGVPCVGVAYSMKFAGVFESVGMEEWVVDGKEVGNSAAVARTLELYRRRDQVREDLAQRADDARKQLKEVFREIIQTATQWDKQSQEPERQEVAASSAEYR